MNGKYATKYTSINARGDSVPLTYEIFSARTFYLDQWDSFVNSSSMPPMVIFAVCRRTCHTPTYQVREGVTLLAW